jgi:hypothetical protein
MFATRVLFAGIVAGVGLLPAGCGRIGGPGGGNLANVGGNAKSVSEERNLTAPHVAGSGLDVHTNVGSVEVVADPSFKEVMVMAKVTAFGETEEEAKARLQDIKIMIGRRDDRVLEISAEFPKEWQGQRGACSFVIRVPEVNGSTARTGNGLVTLKGLGGAVQVHAGVGSITVANQGGSVTTHTGNGATYITKAAGDVQVDASVGSISVTAVAGGVKAKTGNGSTEVTDVGGVVEASASVGSVTVRQAGGAVTIRTGNGALTVVSAKSSVKAKASVGSVMLGQVSGEVEAETGNGLLSYTQAPGSDSSFNLKASVGSVAVRLPASASGTIHAATSVGNVTINGARRNSSVSGERNSKRIVLTEKGPESRIRTGNGTITITLE